MGTMTKPSVKDRLAQAARLLHETEGSIIEAALEAYLPPDDVRLCPVCNGGKTVTRDGKQVPCPQCNGSGVW